MEGFFPQAFGTLTKMGGRLPGIANVGVSDTGFGLAEIDAARRHFVFIGRIGTAGDDALYGMVIHTVGILAYGHKQALGKP